MSTALDFVLRWRIPGLGALLLLEESGIPMPVPGDWVLVALGALSKTHEVSLGEVIPVATIAVTTGASLLFTVATGPGRTLLERHGPRIGLTGERRARVEAWLAHRGSWALIIGRLIPGARVLLTATSGAFGLSRWQFTRAVIPAAALWSLVYFSLGYALGDAYERAASHRALLAGSIGLAGVGVLGARWLIKRRPRPSGS